jgi:type II secretory pathway pseudopilin PulG
MTIVEIIAVVGIIVVLLAILLPALSVASGNARWATSQSNMKQIFQLMQEYTTDNRETIVPAAFDYSGNSYPGNPRSAQPPTATPPLQSENGMRLNYGTWSDILWTYGKFGVPTGVSGGTLDATWSYLYDSPDRIYFEKTPGYSTIFRSSVRMQQAAGGTDALPFGTGSQMGEVGDNGYFAANLLFDARPDSSENLYGDWRTSAEIRRPGKTVYLVDSYHGEVIAPTPEGFGSPADPSGNAFEGQIDFRYPGETSLMLFMDGHVGTEGRWELFDDLKDLRGIQVDSLR